MFYGEDYQLEADYNDYLDRCAWEEMERDIEDDAYNYHILPDFFKSLEEEEKARFNNQICD